jgi:hypothetical protein
MKSFIVERVYGTEIIITVNIKPMAFRDVTSCTEDVQRPDKYVVDSDPSTE